MNKLRSSKLGIVFVVLAMLGLITGPALALGCCCVLPVAPHHHAAPSAMDNMPCCHKATQQTAKNQEHCATQNTPVISRNCDCPQAQAQIFVTNSTPQNGVFATSISTLPLREFAFARAHWQCFANCQFRLAKTSSSLVFFRLWPCSACLLTKS